MLRLVDQDYAWVTRAGEDDRRPPRGRADRVGARGRVRAVGARPQRRAAPQGAGRALGRSARELRARRARRARVARRRDCGRGEIARAQHARLAEPRRSSCASTGGTPGRSGSPAGRRRAPPIRRGRLRACQRPITSRPCSATRQSSCALSAAGSARKWRYSSIRNATRASTGASTRTHSAARMRLEQRVRHLQLADLLALRLDEHRPVRIELPQPSQTRRLEHLLRGLRRAGQVAEHRAAVRRELLEVEHLRAGRGERLQQPALRAAGLAAQHEIAELARLGRELRD